MQSKIPVPTDNIYKFYALFGVIVLISSMWAMVQINDFTNQLILKSAVQIASIQQEGVPTQAQNIEQDTLLKIASIKGSETRIAIQLLTIICLGSLVMIGYGFWHWHRKVQPLLDKEAEICVNIAKLELQKLQAEIEGQRPRTLRSSSDNSRVLDSPAPVDQ